MLAFGELEYLSRRYFSVGWRIPREVCLDELTDSWCYLLGSRLTYGCQRPCRAFGAGIHA